LKQARTVRRNTLALGFSAVFHVAILTLILSQASPDYQTPEAPAPPIDTQIVTLEPPPPPIITPPPREQPRVEPTRPPEPRTPPRAAPPAPAPAQPAPAPPKPGPVTAKPAPVQAEAPRPLPVAPPAPAPKVEAAPRIAPAPPAPLSPAPKTATPAPTAHLNIHKPEKDAPANVATLPLAPAPSPAAPAGGPRAATASGEPALGGSRLNGLSPYPYGAMPSGGGGLRGTLIGCANADAVSLSAAERARCNERFGSEAASAPALDGIAPAKRAAFDKAAAQQEADRKYRAAVPTGTSIGAHGFGGLGPDQPVGLKDQIKGGPQ
jgi:hypothetical protein